MNVGDQLWWTWRERRRGQDAFVTVEKVGRKWISLDNGYRIDAITLFADGAGYSSPGRCWIAKEDWEREEERQQAWQDLRGYVDRLWNPPAGVETRLIRQALASIKPRE